jgi:hypothetical protein
MGKQPRREQGDRLPDACSEQTRAEGISTASRKYRGITVLDMHTWTILNRAVPETEGWNARMLHPRGI